MLAGFVPPYTPSGRSALMPAPPWHYSGTVLSVAYDAADPAACASLLPPGFGTATGRCVVHACEWQATTDGSELLDPAYAQYREMIFLIGVERPEGPAFFCPFIYVDQDIAMARGWLQGWPKKFGSVWMTRSYAVTGVASAPRAAGTRLGATLAAKDRRLAELVVTLAGAPGGGARLGLLAAPSWGLLGAPTLLGERPSAGALRPVRARVSALQIGPLASGQAEVRLFDSPRDEVALLKPRAAGEASLGEVALTVEGATEDAAPGAGPGR